MEVEELVYKAMKASGEESIRAFAKRLDVSHTAVGQWIKGDQIPTFEQAAELAKMAGLPMVSTAAGIRMKSKDGAKHKTLLRQLASTATILAVVCIGTLPSAAHAATGLVESTQVIHYAKLRYYWDWCACGLVRAPVNRLALTWKPRCLLESNRPCDGGQITLLPPTIAL